MALYRVLKRLEKGSRQIHPKTFTQLEWLSKRHINTLIDVGAVSEVGAPPLAVIPGWKTRAGKLEEVGIEDVIQFIEADTSVICQALRRQPKTVEKYRKELLGWMTADAADGG